MKLFGAAESDVWKVGELLVFDETKRRQALGEQLKRDKCFHSRKTIADAEVNPFSKRDVPVGAVAMDIERLGVLKQVRLVVC